MSFVPAGFYPAFPAAMAPMAATLAAANPADVLVAQLGQGTRIGPNGVVVFNEPLIRQVIACGRQAVPALYQALAGLIRDPDRQLPRLIETIYTAERLAEEGVPEVTSLYTLTSYLNTHPNPLLQIYLAGFYREIHRPETFGPMLSTLVNHSVNRYPQPHPAMNPTEEVGGTLLQLIARQTADETVKRLLPYLPTART